MVSLEEQLDILCRWVIKSESWRCPSLSGEEERNAFPTELKERLIRIYSEEHYYDELTSRVFQALGTASVCWENMSGTGVFQSDQAKKVGEELVAWIKSNFSYRV